MENEANQLKSAHVLVFPYPIQGHINPMLQFAKRLASKGLKVTFLTTISLAKWLPSQLEFGVINIKLIYDGLKDGEKVDNHETYMETLQKVAPQSLGDLIEYYNKTTDAVKFIVYDWVTPWVLDFAQTVGINAAPFFTQSAAVHFVHYHVYNEALRIPIEGSLVSVPSLPLLKTEELPSLLVDSGSYAGLNRLNIGASSNFEKATFLLFNTTDKLEEQVLSWMARQWPIMTIGRTIPSMYMDKRLKDDKDYGLSLFKPEADACIQWLDTKESGSVVYISMGSLASLGEAQMVEIAKGLKQSDKPFLWIVRASEESKLPANFKTDVSGQGLIVSWCPQLTVLAHRAVGCFMSHCGWNSTVEAISLGVPVVAMPHWLDQPTNAKHIEEVWKIGVRVKADAKGTVTKDGIEGCIRKVIEGKTGRKFRSNGLKWKEFAKEATAEGGSSDKNIELLANKILSI